MGITFAGGCFYGVASLTALVMQLEGYNSARLIWLAVLVAVVVQLITTHWAGTRKALLRAVTQPLITLYIVFFGYPFAELIADSSNEVATNALVSTAIGLGVLAVPRWKLLRILDADNEARLLKLEKALKGANA